MTTNNEISFSLCFDNNYAKFALGTIFWLYEKNWRDFDTVRINIAHHEDVELEVRDAWRKFAELSPRLEIVEHVVSGEFDKALSKYNTANHNSPQITPATFYRLFLQDWFFDSKTIYIDVDTLPYGPAKKMWEIEFDTPYAASIDLALRDRQQVFAYSYEGAKKEYVYPDIYSAGVLLIDLDRLRHTDTLSLVDEMHRSLGGLIHHDMTFLNTQYAGSITRLPDRFNELDLVYGYGMKQLPFDTVFYSYLFRTKPWAYEGKYCGRFPDRHLKHLFIEGMNYVLDVGGLPTVKWADYQVKS